MIWSVRVVSIPKIWIISRNQKWLWKLLNQWIWFKVSFCSVQFVLRSRNIIWFPWIRNYSWGTLIFIKFVVPCLTFILPWRLNVLECYQYENIYLIIMFHIFIIPCTYMCGCVNALVGVLFFFSFFLLF